MGLSIHWNATTMGENAALIFSWLEPVKMALGMTSPKMSTNVVEKITASHDGTRLFRKMGNASLARAFVSNNVTKRRWWFSMRGRTFLPCAFCSRIRSFSSEDFA